MNIALWIIQALLALLFMFSGVMKFLMSVEDMNKQSPIALSGGLIHFIGVCEILGGIGLILPALLRIKPGLTPLAAVCLIIIMIGAVSIAFIGGVPANAIVPGVTGILLAFVAYGRLKSAPISGK
jgi:uncharacterized membrane protein YphA (DoxX/SURF4 family)